jgi:lysozyme
MKTKNPAAYDVSHWKEIPNFALVNPRPVLFITKATEGVSLVDSKFVRFFDGMREIGVHRGVYHFHRKAADPVKQALHFISTIGPHVTRADTLILDVEEGGETAAQLWAWFETVRKAFPDNLYLLYGRKNLLDPIPMTPWDREYFKKIPIWPAGYPMFPDLFSSIPSVWPMNYVPDQSKWGPVYLWQYSDKGYIDGIVGEVDLNLISPVFMTLLDQAPVVVPDIRITIRSN